MSNGGAAFESGRVGYVGRINYSFADKYLFQANFRQDGSYNFAPNERWGFFPAVSAAWRISQESFMKDISFISNLKLRASYGQFGNDRIPQYQYLSSYIFAPGYITGSTYNTGISNTGIANPNVTWETATNTDIGLDLGLFNSALVIEMTYFNKRTKNILLPPTASIPASFGAILPYENIGVIDDRGFELDVKHSNHIGKLSYSIEGNLTLAKSNIVYMDEPTNVPDRLRQTGRPLGQTFGLIATGYFQNQAEINSSPDQDGQHNASIKPGDIKYQDINHDGKIDGSDVTAIGKSTIPQMVYGFNFNVGYKGFGLIASFQGAAGFDKYIQPDFFDLEANALTVAANSWRPGNTSAQFPRLTTGVTPNNSQVSTQWLLDNTYLRLRNVELYYTLSSSVVKSLHMQKVQVFVSGNNILTFSKQNYTDPEAPSTYGNFLYYPQMKSYNVGINVTF
jgi:TonB-linked SusC/RagA family outer membrane protein